jgi:hypothetical protein
MISHILEKTILWAAQGSLSESVKCYKCVRCSIFSWSYIYWDVQYLDGSCVMWTILYYSSFAYNARTLILNKNSRIFINEQRGTTCSTGINLKGLEKNSETFSSRTTGTDLSNFMNTWHGPCPYLWRDTELNFSVSKFVKSVCKRYILQPIDLCP